MNENTSLVKNIGAGISIWKTNNAEHCYSLRDTVLGWKNNHHVLDEADTTQHLLITHWETTPKHQPITKSYVNFDFLRDNVPASNVFSENMATDKAQIIGIVSYGYQNLESDNDTRFYAVAVDDNFQ